jgi:glycosyltransferase involved in cell wall biosynthesis
MRILHIVTSLNVGGIETMLIEIVNEQVKSNKVSVIILNNKVNQSLLDQFSKFVRIYEISRPKGSKNPYYFFKFNLLLLKINTDIIHCHGVAIVKYLFFKKKKIVLTAHSTGLQDKAIFKYAKVYAISKAVKDDLKTRLNLNATLVYNGVNSKFIKSKLGSHQSTEVFKILCVGRLDNEIKGQDLLAEAIKIINTHKTIDIKLSFIGSGPSFDSLIEFVKQNNLETKIEFLGLKERSFVYSILSEYDLFVQPSRREGFGLTIVEAMLAKIPVLVSDLPGPMEIICNGKLGYSFVNGNSSDLAKKIIYIKNRIKKAETLDRIYQAFNYAKENFNIKKTAANYVFEYNKLDKSSKRYD